MKTEPLNVKPGDVVALRTPIKDFQGKLIGKIKFSPCRIGYVSQAGGIWAQEDNIVADNAGNVVSYDYSLTGQTLEVVEGLTMDALDWFE